MLASALALAIGAVPASGRVLEATATGFRLQHEVEVGAAQATAWRTLLDVGAWWNPAHTYSGAARNLHLDARPGGCFCERLPHGGGVEHLRVVFVAPPSTLRLGGALGPLQGSGLSGSLTFALAARPDGGTRIRMDYVVGGYLPGGFESMAPAVDAVLGEQLERLRRRLEPAR
ncbi:MAG: SRPBCC family protein [Steroidobacteraceae bacterium]